MLEEFVLFKIKKIKMYIRYKPKIISRHVQCIVPPPSGSEIPTTQTSRIAGCARIMFSISVGEI